MADNNDFCEICESNRDYISVTETKTLEDGTKVEVVHTVLCGSGRYPHPCYGVKPIHRGE